MARFKLKFLDFKKSAKTISVNAETDFLYFIKIEIINENTKEINFIELDKSTAIKFAKTLRTEINVITDKEGAYNG
jgi:hypothetical protein